MPTNEGIFDGDLQRGAIIPIFDSIRVIKIDVRAFVAGVTVGIAELKLGDSVFQLGAIIGDTAVGAPENGDYRGSIGIGQRLAEHS